MDRSGDLRSSARAGSGAESARRRCRVRQTLAQQSAGAGSKTRAQHAASSQRSVVSGERGAPKNGKKSKGFRSAVCIFRSRLNLPYRYGINLSRRANSFKLNFLLQIFPGASWYCRRRSALPGAIPDGSRRPVAPGRVPYQPRQWNGGSAKMRPIIPKSLRSLLLRACSQLANTVVDGVTGGLRVSFSPNVRDGRYYTRLAGYSGDLQSRAGAGSGAESARRRCRVRQTLAQQGGLSDL